MMYWSLQTPAWDIDGMADKYPEAVCPYCFRIPVFRSVGFFRLRFRMECVCGVCGPKVEWTYGTNPKVMAADAWDEVFNAVP